MTFAHGHVTLYYRNCYPMSDVQHLEICYVLPSHAGTLAILLEQKKLLQVLGNVMFRYVCLFIFLKYIL